MSTACTSSHGDSPSVLDEHHNDNNNHAWGHDGTTEPTTAYCIKSLPTTTRPRCTPSGVERRHESAERRLLEMLQFAYADSAARDSRTDERRHFSPDALWTRKELLLMRDGDTVIDPVFLASRPVFLTCVADFFVPGYKLNAVSISFIDTNQNMQSTLKMCTSAFFMTNSKANSFDVVLSKRDIYDLISLMSTRLQVCDKSMQPLLYEGSVQITQKSFDSMDNVRDWAGGRTITTTLSIEELFRQAGIPLPSTYHPIGNPGFPFFDIKLCKNAIDSLCRAYKTIAPFDVSPKRPKCVTKYPVVLDANFQFFERFLIHLSRMQMFLQTGIYTRRPHYTTLHKYIERRNGFHGILIGTAVLKTFYERNNLSTRSLMLYDLVYPTKPLTPPPTREQLQLLLLSKDVEYSQSRNEAVTELDNSDDECNDAPLEAPARPPSEGSSSTDPTEIVPPGTLHATQTTRQESGGSIDVEALDDVPEHGSEQVSESVIDQPTGDRTREPSFVTGCNSTSEQAQEEASDKSSTSDLDTSAEASTTIDMDSRRSDPSTPSSETETIERLNGKRTQDITSHESTTSAAKRPCVSTSDDMGVSIVTNTHLPNQDVVSKDNERMTVETLMPIFHKMTQVVQAQLGLLDSIDALNDRDLKEMKHNFLDVWSNNFTRYVTSKTAFKKGEEWIEQQVSELILKRANEQAALIMQQATKKLHCFRTSESS